MLLLLLLVPQETLIYESVDVDAAPIYQAFAGSTLEIPDFLFDYLDGAPADAAKVADAIAPFSKTLDRLHEAARAKRCVWSYPGRGTYFPECSVVGPGRAAHALAARTRLRLEQGDLDGAVEDALVGWRAAYDHLSDGPKISYITGTIMLGAEESALQVGLAERDLGEARLRRMAAHARRLLDRYPSYKAVMRAEKAQALDGIDRAIEDFPALARRLEAVFQNKPPPAEAFPGADEVKAMLQADREASRTTLRKRVSDYWEKVLHDADPPPGSSALQVDKEQLIRDGTAAWVKYQTAKDPEAGREAAAALYLCLILPDAAGNRVHHGRTRLRLELRLAWCLLELHFAKHGRYPADLAALDFSAKDPWYGKPPAYRPAERGFVLSATGPANDADERMQRFVEKADFDPARFRALSAPGSDGLGWTLWRVRR